MKIQANLIYGASISIWALFVLGSLCPLQLGFSSVVVFVIAFERARLCTEYFVSSLFPSISLARHWKMPVNNNRRSQSEKKANFHFIIRYASATLIQMNRFLLCMGKEA